MKIKDITKKAVIVKHNLTLKWIMKIMTKEDVNWVLVVDSDWKLIWSIDIVTILKAIVPEYIWDRDMSVADFTTEKVFRSFINDNLEKTADSFMLETPKVIDEDSTILHACITVTEWRQTRIPVIDTENRPIWIITRRWVRKYLANEMGL